MKEYIWVPDDFAKFEVANSLSVYYFGFSTCIIVSPASNTSTFYCNPGNFSLFHLFACLCIASLCWLGHITMLNLSSKSNKRTR